MVARTIHIDQEGSEWPVLLLQNCCQGWMMTPLPPPVTEIRIFNVTSIYM